MTKSTITREESIQAVFDLKVGYTLGLADIEILKRVARMALAAMDSEPAPVVPVVPDEMLCEFYEVDSWPDLVRELVKHVEQLQYSARRNVKPWEDTFPETLLPAYIERVKQADDACRAAMLNGGKS
ncbi:hypothetical protein [Klebsiella pneumoniae]|uniref:hypothetical protein n=1 Tax=Klebsiella pneumoniae TaxID=573 RepID=UPI002FF42D7D